MLETVGRKSGKPRSSPVVYARDGDAYVIVAAAAGVRTPAWWLNLRDRGEGTLVVDGLRVGVRPRVAEGDERTRLWERYLAVYPPAEEYPRLNPALEMPVVVLEPA